jgi:CMP-N-acetylneuraminic acid synthetase
MLQGKRVLAVVPARSGSKSVPHKNLRVLAGTSLIGWAGRTLARVPFLDARLISTDSAEYAEEGRRHGLDAPFLRPPELSYDTAGAVETLQHALRASEAHYGTTFDVVLIVETRPLSKTKRWRLAEVVEAAK